MYRSIQQAEVGNENQESLMNNIMFNWYINLVALGVCICGSSETNPMVGSVKYRIETFKEGLAIDEVKALPTG